jgi:hypothetical protein
VADYFSRRGYALYASPKLYSGQTVQAAISTDNQNAQHIDCGLYIQVYGPDDKLVIMRSPHVTLTPGASHTFNWPISDLQGAPIAAVGVEVRSEQRGDGTLYLDYLTWDGAPNVVFRRPDYPGEMWRWAWVDGMDQYNARWPEAFRLVQNQGRGLLMQGTREWTDYQVSADITPHLVKAAGIAARVQGMRRFYALLLCEGDKARLIKALDGDTILGEIEWPWTLGETHKLRLQVAGRRIEAFIDGQQVFTVADDHRPLDGGGVALVCEEGCMSTNAVHVEPAG